MKRGCELSFHVIAVILAIAYIYFSTVFVFIKQWFGLGSSPGMLNAVVFTLLASMCVFSYRTAIVTGPGRVPSSFVPDIEDSDNQIREIKRKDGNLRYCQKCSHYKPPRAHHCRICNRCVLRMVLLIGSLTVEPQQDAEDSLRIVYIISGLLLVPLSLALSFFLCWHIYLMIHNKTTIEYHEGVRAMWLAEKGGQLYSHPYDIGLYENLTETLGPNVLCWAFPTASHIGSGLRFRTKYDNLSVLSTPNVSLS